MGASVNGERQKYFCETKLKSKLIRVCVHHHFFSLSFSRLFVLPNGFRFHFIPSISLSLSISCTSSSLHIKLRLRKLNLYFKINYEAIFRLINRSIALEERHKWLPPASELFSETEWEQHIDVSHGMPNFWQHPICHFILVTVRAFDATAYLTMSLTMTQRILWRHWCLLRTGQGTHTDRLIIEFLNKMHFIFIRAAWCMCNVYVIV